MPPAANPAIKRTGAISALIILSRCSTTTASYVPVLPSTATGGRGGRSRRASVERSRSQLPPTSTDPVRRRRRAARRDPPTSARHTDADAEHATTPNRKRSGVVTSSATS
jgi:hypothetical protein